MTQGTLFPKTVLMAATKLLKDSIEFETGRARRNDPDTAKKAAASIKVADLEARVLDALRNSAGLTTHELSRMLAVDLVSVSPRLRPLANKNLVCDSGERRRSENGRASIVWKAI